MQYRPKRCGPKQDDENVGTMFNTGSCGVEGTFAEQWDGLHTPSAESELKEGYIPELRPMLPFACVMNSMVFIVYSMAGNYMVRLG